MYFNLTLINRMSQIRMDIVLDSCRICLETANLEGIFKEKCEPGDVPIWKKIVYCASVQVASEDSLPKMICGQCRYYLDIAYIFKTVCVATDEKLRRFHLIDHTKDASEVISLTEDKNRTISRSNSNEGNGINILDVNSDFETDAPKEVLKVGRHVAKKITGKFPQKLQSGLNNKQNIIKDNLTKDKVLLNDINFGNKCHIHNFEDVSEGDVPVVGFEETVITDNDSFPFVVQTEIIDYPEAFTQTSGNEQCLHNADILNSHGEHADDTNKIETKLNSTLRRGKRKVNVFDDHRKTKKKDIVKKVKKISSRKPKNCFKCDVCSKSFLFKSHLDRHLNMHAGIKKYICEYCQQKFINSYNLSVHILKHTGEFPLKCDLCNKGFPNPSLLKRHKASHTGEANFQCRYCSVKFTQSSSLRLHEKMHLHRPSYHCDVCYKVFSYTNSLAAHKKQHFSAKRYTCNTCLSTFSRKSSLVRHMDGHKPKRVKCKLCGALFSNKSSYNIHMKAHCRYRCDVCGEGFQNKANCVNHMKIHKEVLKCEECFRVFPNTNQLIKHLERHK